MPRRRLRPALNAQLEPGGSIPRGLSGRNQGSGPASLSSTAMASLSQVSLPPAPDAAGSGNVPSSCRALTKPYALLGLKGSFFSMQSPAGFHGLLLRRSVGEDQSPLYIHADQLGGKTSTKHEEILELWRTKSSRKCALSGTSKHFRRLPGYGLLSGRAGSLTYLFWPQGFTSWWQHEETCIDGHPKPRRCIWCFRPRNHLG